VLLEHCPRQLRVSRHVSLKNSKKETNFNIPSQQHIHIYVLGRIGKSTLFTINSRTAATLRNPEKTSARVHQFLKTCSQTFCSTTTAPGFEILTTTITRCVPIGTETGDGRTRACVRHTVARRCGYEHAARARALATLLGVGMANAHALIE
jgi:hypothetical protein